MNRKATQKKNGLKIKPSPMHNTVSEFNFRGNYWFDDEIPSSESDGEASYIELVDNVSRETEKRQLESRGAPLSQRNKKRKNSIFGESRHSFVQINPSLVLPNKDSF